ncbi:hypothetical protein AAFN75_04060 [Algibacter sp. AS12]|uniref:hypothetical protein n=1 Tax=Algibacter sp. AS12 TaxID=3135773 RepID=UPI00398B4E10
MLKKEDKKAFFYYLKPLEHKGKNVDNDTEYLTDVLFGEGARFIKESSKMYKPFFLFMSYNAPQTPLEAEKEDLEFYSGMKR